MRRSLHLPLLAASTAFLLGGCAPGHRLADVDLAGQSVAVMAPIPPTPRVVTGPWPLVRQAVQPPPGEIRRRFDASRAAQSRLDSASVAVDPAEALARTSLLESARQLRFRPEGDPEAANLILDVRLLEFSFTAASFDSAVRSYVEADVSLSRGDTGEIVWHRRFRERDTVDPALFGAADLGRRLTPREMTRLTREELATGIEWIMRHTADRITSRLVSEYRAAHR